LSLKGIKASLLPGDATSIAFTQLTRTTGTSILVGANILVAELLSTLLEPIQALLKASLLGIRDTRLREAAFELSNATFEATKATRSTARATIALAITLKIFQRLLEPPDGSFDFIDLPLDPGNLVGSKAMLGQLAAESGEAALLTGNASKDARLALLPGSVTAALPANMSSETILELLKASLTTSDLGLKLSLLIRCEGRISELEAELSKFSLALGDPVSEAITA